MTTLVRLSTNNKVMGLQRKAMLLMLIFTFMLSWNIYQGETYNLAKIKEACRPEDGYIRCLTGDQCIVRNWHHDLAQNCEDSSDETRASLNCSDNEITCGRGRCVERTLVHRQQFCPDQDNIRFLCRPDEFTCHITKRCLYRWEVRDGKVNCNTLTVEDSSDEEVFLPLCMKSEFMCPSSHRCIPREWVGDGLKDCLSGVDETEQFNECRSKTEFKCKESGRCIPRYRVMDGFNDCQNGTDELIPLTCIPDKEIECKVNGRCIPRSWRLNNIIDCPNGGDETPLSMDETCTSDEFLCHNHKRCIPNSYLCDGMDHCGDCSDEIESCAEPRLLRCPNDPTGTCIHWDQACDTFGNCPNTLYPVTSVTGFKCHRNLNYYCLLPQYSLTDDLSSCNDGSDLCYRNGSFQCATCLDGMTVIAPRQICDGVIDCPDLSDECLCSKDNSRSNEICNNICYGGSSNSCSICNVGEVVCDKDSLCITKDQVCNGHVDCPLSLQDERVCGQLNLTSTLISTKEYFKCGEVPEAIQSVIKSFSSWQWLASNILVETATKCDGVFECPYFEDECGARANCEMESPLCNAIPFRDLHIPLLFNLPKMSRFVLEVRWCEGKHEVVVGRSICNGIKECTSNLDEMFCPERFQCDAGTISWPTGIRSIVSINSTQRCDLNVDCIDSSDELNCADETHFYCESKDPLFVSRDRVLDGVADCTDQSDECPEAHLNESAISSREFLIKSAPLNILIWFMAFFALLGNAYVVFKTIKALALKVKNLPLKSTTTLTTINNILILNLSISDFLMGVVLFVIIAKSRTFSGQYCLKDYLWRTGTTCSAIGVLTVLSSETSVFTLVCISSYRLYSIFYPFASRSMRKRWLGLWILLIWFASLIISILPLLPFLSNYMITEMWIDGNNPYFSRDTTTLSDLKDFTKGIVTLNGTIYTGSIPQDWYGLQTFLTSNFPNQSPTSRGYFGYYSASGLCIPKFYRSELGETSNTLTSVVITFNFLALMYIIAVYIAIYHNIKVKGAVVSKSDQKEKQLKTMQRKITILIATDLCCWLPICIMTFISMSGVILPSIAYAVSAIILLPINSSLNPIIYSNALTLVWKKIKQWMDQTLKNIKMSSNVSEQERNISSAL